ncbi:mitochondrial carrier domain-containing protein [Daldinia eschscholtzii]|nr:mitochondrial carrier domain-containing protein [Daldinia eschscholtzii]
MPSTRFANYIDTRPIPTAADDDKFLSALHHAVSGSAGTLISTCALYPLSLAITRLQARGQSHREEARLNSSSSTCRSSDGDITPTGPTAPAAAAAAATAPGPAREPPPDGGGITEAFSRIWSSGGAPKARYTGLARDAARSALDSFLFFLFYEWFRSVGLGFGAGSSRGRRGGRADRSVVPGLGLGGVLEELAIGVAAGACSKLFSTPVANVAARKQAASFVNGDDARVRDIIDGIRKEQGLRGFWSGYTTDLVHTLNSSITFFLQEFLKKKTVSVYRWDNPGAYITFLFAAISKTIATALTYPFQTASTRLQTGDLSSPKSSSSNGGEAAEKPTTEEETTAFELPKLNTQGRRVTFDEDISPKTVEVPCKVSFRENLAPPEQFPGCDRDPTSDALRAIKSFGKSSVFGAALQIARTEGVGALYKGIFGELVKGSLDHGTAMLAKDVVHRMLFKLYFVVAGVLAEMRVRRAGGKTGGVVRTETRTESVVFERAPVRSPSGATIGAPPEPEFVIEAPIRARPGTPPPLVQTSSSLPPSPPLIKYKSEPLTLSPPPRQPSPVTPQKHSSPPSLHLASAVPHQQQPPIPPRSPQHQLHSLRYRYDSNYDRYRYERLPSPPPTPYPAAGYGHRWSPRNHTGGRSFLTGDDDEDDEDGGASVVANVIESAQRGVKYY